MSNLDPREKELKAAFGQFAAAAEAHPAGSALVAFDEDPAQLSEETRAWIARHLESCAACKDALSAVPPQGSAMEKARTPLRFRPMLAAAGWILAAILCVRQLVLPVDTRAVLGTQTLTLSQARGETKPALDAPGRLRDVDLVRFECVLGEDVQVGQKLHLRVLDGAGKNVLETDAVVDELNQFGWPVIAVRRAALPKGRLTIHVRAPSGSEIAAVVDG